MHKIESQTESLTIKLFLKNSISENITVDKCVEIKSDIRLPTRFLHYKLIGNKMYSKLCLQRFNNVLKVIHIESKNKITPKNVAKTLKRLHPSLFDKKYILIYNQKNYIAEFRNDILADAIKILGKNYVKNMAILDIFGEYNKCTSMEEEESFIEEMSDLFADEVLSEVEWT